MRAILFSLSLLACTDPDLEPPDLATPEPAPGPIAEVAQTGFIEHADAVPGSYIVVLHDTRAPLDATIDRLAADRATVVNRYTHALRGFSATMTDDAARALAADPAVAYVEANQRMYGDASVTTNATWGIDRIDQASLPLDTKYYGLADGSTVTAYVFDTGIRATHTELAGRLLPGYAGVTTDTQGTNDCHGHGTHVSGTIGGTVLGVAKKVSIVPVRILDCNNAGTLDSFLAGVDWVIANKRPRAVANMSVAFNPPNTTVDNKVRALINAGVTVVVSAGNRNTDACTQSPARTPEAITVAAIDKADTRATFSNHGTCVDLFAPGVDIFSASNAGDNLGRLYSGTSQATPHVTGVATIYLSTHPMATPAQVAAALVGGTVPNKVVDVLGSPNKLLSAKIADTTAPIVAISSPAAGDMAAQTVTVTATASDANLARVALKVDGAEVASVPATANPSYQLVASNLAPGSHVLEVVATDLADLTATQRVTVTIANPDPSDPSMPADPDAPEQTAGGCAATGGTGGVGVLLALLACTCHRRPRRRLG